MTLQMIGFGGNILCIRFGCAFELQSRNKLVPGIVLFQPYTTGALSLNGKVRVNNYMDQELHFAARTAPIRNTLFIGTGYIRPAGPFW